MEVVDILPGEKEMAQQWMMTVFPRLIQLGYAPKPLGRNAELDREAESMQDSLQQVLKCTLVIADITVPEAETWMYAGYALGNEIPVAWTCRSSATGSRPSGIQPIVWEDAEQLAGQLQSVFGR